MSATLPPPCPSPVSDDVTTAFELVLVDPHAAQGWRSHSGERIDGLFEDRCDWIRAYGRDDRDVVDAGERVLTYAELDARSNQLARFLRLRGIVAGDRVAVLCDRRDEAYAGVLAVLKIGATCVPLDIDAPSERISSVVQDAGARLVLTRSHPCGWVGHMEALRAAEAELLCLDEVARVVDEMGPGRLQPAERGHGADTAFLLYPPGPTGGPDGVAINHRGLCNAVRVVCELYGLADDSLNQGCSPTSGGALGEIWLAWATGSTLVPGRASVQLQDAELTERLVTTLLTTPTVLATLEDDAPLLRFLAVSGEACPQSLFDRWCRTTRRIVNAYVPTGATLPAEWIEAYPENPVTVGVPLPTHVAVVLDPVQPRRALPRGAVGELGIAGIGLACGYPTRNAGGSLVEDFVGLPGNPSGQTYRTGDLARVNDAGQIEYRGRPDTQVSVDGARVDLHEIESVMLTVPGVAVAVVAAHRAPSGVVELVGYYTRRADSPGPGAQEILAWLRERLPAQHVPVRLEAVAAIPMTALGHVDRAALRPTGVGATQPDMADANIANLERLRAENARLKAELQRLRLASAPAPQPPAPSPLPRTPFPSPSAFWPAVDGRAETSPMRSPTRQAPQARPAQCTRPTPPPMPVRVSSATVVAGLAEVLAEVLGVDRVRPDQHIFDELGADSMVMTKFCALVRKRSNLPSVSIRDVYANPTLAALAGVLTATESRDPAPSTQPPAGTALAHRGTTVEAGLPEVLADILAEVLGVDRVRPDQHVFDELGADSMVMAQFCARLRKRPDLPSVTIKDVFSYPTTAGLARAYARPRAPAPEPRSAPAPAPRPRRLRSAAYLFCGFLQTLAFLGYAAVAGIVTDQAYTVISVGTDLLDVYVRAAAVGGVVFVSLSLLPILAKWMLVWRWREGEVRVWSLRYFRFWLVKTMIRGNPLVLVIVGTPLYALYLRALGAKIGRGVLILSRHVPVCTDLITIGAGTVIRKDAHLTGFAAVAGTIRTGRVTLGRDVIVGEKSVLDIGTAMGDGAQLGHASSLHAGQTVPPGARFHGSPAVPTRVDHRRVARVRVSAVRKVAYSLFQLFKVLGIYLPLAFGGLILLLTDVPRLRAVLDPGPVDPGQPSFYLDALVGSAVVVLGGLLAGLLLVCTLPRLLNLAVRPDRVHPLYGMQYGLHRAIARLTNIKTLIGLFGDSSYVVAYLRGIGYDLGRVEQTGSNFGSAVAQDSPFLSAVGTGTVVADGLSIVNADVSATSFRVAPVVIGARSFLGNDIAYPTGSRAGDNCLLATKVMVPIDGPVREGVGLLGSPAFEIPRSVRRDRALEVGRDELRRRLRRKNGHNLRTIALALLVRWVQVAGLLILALLAIDLYPTYGPVSFSAEIVLSMLFALGFHVLVERLGGGFRRRRPQSCSIYDPIFWRHERYWKLVMPSAMDRALAGTPWKNLVTRLLGARIGRRVFDNGAAMTERTLLTIGDDVTLDEGSILQCHSQEDGAFRDADRTVLGAGVTVRSALSIRRHRRRRRRDRSRLLPHEGRGGSVPRALGWQPRPGTVRPRQSRGPRPGDPP